MARLIERALATAAVMVALCSSAVPAGAQFIGDYGGGWGPSLDTSIALGNDVLALEMGMRAGGAEPTRGARAVSARPTTATPPASFFNPAPVRGGATRNARFTRSPAVTKAVQAELLRAIGQRQPDAVADYRKSFAGNDWAKAFAAIAAPYGLGADDAIDALTGYWVMAWVVANQAELPSPAAVKAARAQVATAYAAGPLAAADDGRRQRVADEAIFNFMVLNGAWRNEAGGANAGPLAEATRRGFMPLGGDLTRLALSEAGFAQR